MLAASQRRVAVYPAALQATSNTFIPFPQRSFARGLATPLSKLHHIIHPRYGKVYPVIALDRKTEFPNVARFSTVFLSVFNASVMYSAFAMPIYTAQFSAFVANPLFLIPSIFTNYFLYKRYYSLFYMDRSMITSIFLTPDGRQIICETRDGDSVTVNNSDIYQQRVVDLKYDKRREFYHGANKYK